MDLLDNVVFYTLLYLYYSASETKDFVAVEQ